jgi:hypothetical protein
MTTPQSPADATAQRDALLDSQRRANEGQPRNFKDDALTDKVLSVEPDGTGPTPTETFDTETDQALGSGNDDPTPKTPAGKPAARQP